MATEEVSIPGYFDIHCHILPGIDDGPKTMDEAMRMLLIAYEEGIRVIIATPHDTPHNGYEKHQKIKDVYHNLISEVAQAGLEINILLGSEIYFNNELIDSLNNKNVVTLDETRYILIEFNPVTNFKQIWISLNHCIFAGYIPILAHVERYHCFIKNPNYVEELIHLGVYIQMNISSIKGCFIHPRVCFCRKLLKKRWVHFLGTDAHNSYDRVPKIKGYIKVLKRYGEMNINQLLWENPMTMMENKHLFD